jgi:hypothetical protein
MFADSNPKKEIPMKKTLSALILALILISGPLMSQKHFYFGVGGGGLNTWITNQNNYGLPFDMDTKITFGGAFNANIGFDFNDNIGLKLEIGYAMLGQKYSDTHKDTVYTRDINLNYLTIPLMFKYRSGGKVAKFYVMAGPEFLFLLSATQTYTKHDDPYNESFQPSDWPKPILVGQSTITERYNSMDIAGRLDLGADINLGEHLFLNVGVTMAYGFMDINASDYQIPNYSSHTYDPSHNVFGGINVGINYILPVGAKK